VPEPVAVTARHPAILAGYGAFEIALERSERVEERLKELAGVKAAMVAGCEFCLDIDSALARRGGVTEAQLRALASTPRARSSPRALTARRRRVRGGVSSYDPSAGPETNSAAETIR